MAEATFFLHHLPTPPPPSLSIGLIHTTPRPLLHPQIRPKACLSFPFFFTVASTCRRSRRLPLLFVALAGERVEEVAWRTKGTPCFARYPQT